MKSEKFESIKISSMTDMYYWFMTVHVNGCRVHSRLRLRDEVSESEYEVCGARDGALIIAVTNTVTDHKPIDRDTNMIRDSKTSN